MAAFPTIPEDVQIAIIQATATILSTIIQKCPDDATADAKAKAYMQDIMNSLNNAYILEYAMSGTDNSG